MDNISVQEQLPEGAVPLDSASVPVAQSVAVGAGSPKVPTFKAREPIAIMLPDGRQVGMAVPKAAQSQFLAGILKDVEFKDAKMMAAEKLQVKSLLYVTDIDGQTVDKPIDGLSRYKLEQELGDDGVDLVLLAYVTHFPPIDDSQLVVIKKF